MSEIKTTKVIGIITAVQNIAKEFKGIKSRGICIDEKWYDIDYLSDLVNYDDLFKELYVRGNKVEIELLNNKKIQRSKVISKNNLLSSFQPQEKKDRASYHNLLERLINKSTNYKFEIIDSSIERDLPILSKHNNIIEHHTVAISKVRITTKLLNETIITAEAIGDASYANVSSNIAPSIIRMAECVPLDSKILTNTGWKYYNELLKDENILAYDSESDKLKWTKLEKVSVFENAKLVSLKSKSFNMKCTPDHKWIVNNNEKKLLRPTNKFKSSDSIVLSAVAEEPINELNITEREASILGWLCTDGTIQKQINRMFISQSKPNYLSELKELLGKDGTIQNSKPRSRTFPSGKTYDCLSQNKYCFNTKFTKEFLTKIKFENYMDIPKLVLRLNSKNRNAMLDAMLKGDGTKKSNGSWVFGKKRKEGVMEAFRILATLQGYTLGQKHYSSVGNVPLVTLRNRNKISTSYLTIKNEKNETVWCPTTKYGTWIMNQNDCISITGNTRAYSRALRTILGEDTTKEEM